MLTESWEKEVKNCYLHQNQKIPNTNDFRMTHIVDIDLLNIVYFADHF